MYAFLEDNVTKESAKIQNKLKRKCYVRGKND